MSLPLFNPSQIALILRLFKNSSAIYLTNVGTVELKVGGYNSIGSKFDDTSDVVVRDLAAAIPLSTNFSSVGGLIAEADSSDQILTSSISTLPR